MFLWRRVAPQSPEDGIKPTATPGYTRNFRDLNRKVSEGKSFSGYERNPLFLNLGGKGFTDVAGLVGVDFDDDSRAVAVMDWNRDGAPDLWVTNRTAPRVRLLKNNLPSANGNAKAFVAIRLQGNGTTTNRDAVGARLSLWPASDPNDRQMRTVHAGNGFLAQSSAWTHFGLGATTDVLTLSVAWPGGDTETFQGLQPGGRYAITQHQQEPARSSLMATATPAPAATPENPDAPGLAGFWVANRVPFPELTYADAAGSAHSTTDFIGQPVLINLWATWCAPCLEELNLFAGQAEALRAQGATVLALNVDGLAVDGGAGPVADPEQVLARVGYTLPRGTARQDGLARIEVLIEFLSARRGPLSIPSSFLVDAGGNVAAVYLEAVSWNQLENDLALLDAPPEAQLARVSPRAGRWLADPRQIDRAAYLGDYATLFATSGLPGESQRLYQMIKPAGGNRNARDYYNLAKAAAQQGQQELAMEHYRAALRLEPDFGQALTGLGALFLLQKRIDEARPLFEDALRIDPNHATALVNLAMIDQARGDTESALGRLRKVISLNPDYAEARLNLGSLLASMKNYEEAIDHLSQAVKLNPKLEIARINLAAAYMDTRQWSQAEEQYQSIVQINPGMAYSHYGSGTARARQGKHADAVASFRMALSLGGVNAPTYTQLALSLLAMGERQAAEEALRAALKLDPRNNAARRVLTENGFQAGQ